MVRRPRLFLTAIAILAVSCSDYNEPQGPVRGLNNSNAVFVAPPKSVESVFDDISVNVPEFAGFYFVDGRMYVNVTTTQAVDRLTRIVGSIATEVSAAETPPVFMVVPYSFRQLTAWRNVAIRALKDGDVNFIDLDERANKVVVSVKSLGAAEQLTTRAAFHGIPKDAIAFVIGQQSTSSTLNDRVRPLVGGITIEPPYGGCTHGPLVRYGGRRAFVVNAHCTSVPYAADGGVFYQNVLLSGNRVGVEIHDPYNTLNPDCPAGFTCRYSDAAVVAYDDSVTWDLGGIARTVDVSSYQGSLDIDPASPTRRITSGPGILAYDGILLHRTGHVSGTTYGTVTRTCVDSYIDPQNNRLLRCQVHFLAKQRPGDSGSPVWRLIDSNNVELFGIAHSIGVDEYGRDYTVFSDWYSLFTDHAANANYEMYFF